VCCLGKKIRLALPLSLVRGSRPKSVRPSWPAPENILRVLQISFKIFFQIGSLSAELYRTRGRKRPKLDTLYPCSQAVSTARDTNTDVQNDTRVHGSCWSPVNTGVIFDTRVNGPWTRPAGEHGPWTRVACTELNDSYNTPLDGCVREPRVMLERQLATCCD